MPTICSYLLFLFMSVFPLLAYARPIIEFTKEKHYAGKVRSGINVRHTFEVINKGDTDLIIEKLDPS